MANEKPEVPQLGELPADTPASIRELLEAIIDTIDVREGRGRVKSVRFVKKSELDAANARIALLEARILQLEISGDGSINGPI